MNLIEQMQNVIEKITIDLGNSNYKMIVDDKRIIDSSNTEEVAEGTVGAYAVNGKYYLFGEGAAAKYTTNKIVEDKKALLGKALYSVAEDSQKLEITTLLPLSLYIHNQNKERYQELLKGEYVVTNPSQYTKKFEVVEVNVCCEGFSALITKPELLKEAIYLVEIGGVDLTGCFVNRTPVASQSFATEQGMNRFYKELAKVLTSKLLEGFSDKDAELVYNKYEVLEEELKEIIDSFAMEYIQKNIYKKLVDKGYKKLIHKLVLVGGGAIALERYLKQDTNIITLENALWANVEGAEIIEKRRAK